LIEEISLLELVLQCQLQVVHVPEIVMIQQGTDRLSRGVWLLGCTTCQITTSSSAMGLNL
jgi:hypothetical protein